jgi:integrase
MPRKPKPYLHQGWWVSEAGGKYRRLVPESAGFEAAIALLASQLAGAITGPTLRQAFETFLTHARTYYRLPSGKLSSEPRCYEFSFKQLLDLYADLPANSLRRPHVVAARQRMIDAKISRRVINQSVGRIKRAVRWLCESGHLGDEVYNSISIVRGLPAYRSPAPELLPVSSVPEDSFFATIPYLSDPWRSIALLQWYSGMRPGDACGIKLSYLDTTSSECWIADFMREHKMGYRGKSHQVAVGPKGIDVLRSWATVATQRGRDYVFLVRGRKTPVQVSSYAHAVQRACVAAGVQHWHPNQIRHSFGTRVREKWGLEGAQVALDHARADVTQVYAESAVNRRVEIAKEIG